MTLIMITFLGGEGFAGSSASFNITSEILDGGAAVVNSSSYRLLTKSRPSQLTSLTSTSYNFGLGFLKSAYFVRPVVILSPIITSIIPPKGNNTGVVNITELAGANFRAGAAVRLSKTGASDIIAGNVVVESQAKITCQFDLTGKTVGLWSVTVINSDGQSGSLPDAYKIEAPTILIIGPVESTQNPFNPAVAATSIKYNLSKDTNIILSVFNIRGEKVWERVYAAGGSGASAGANAIVWDGITDFKSVASFGVYIVVITTKDGGSVKELGRTKIAVVK